MTSDESLGRWIDLTGKVAFVSGAAQGIGAGIAGVFARAGGKVVVADINGAGAAKTAQRIGAVAMRTDVSNVAEFEGALDETKRLYGSLDILVNNAGVIAGLGQGICGFGDELWNSIMRVNLDGVFYGCRAAARLMMASGKGGRIINISSVNAIAPGAGVAYDCSKAAVAQLTRTLALELAPHGINVNAIAPGPTWSPDGPCPEITGVVPPAVGNALSDTIANHLARVPARRWITPEEIGRTALYLASEMSVMVHGVYLPVDGGWLVL